MTYSSEYLYGVKGWRFKYMPLIWACKYKIRLARELQTVLRMRTRRWIRYLHEDEAVRKIYAEDMLRYIKIEEAIEWNKKMIEEVS